MTLSNITLTGDRVLIALDEHPTHTVTKGNIVVPRFEQGVTEGGKPRSDLDSRKHLSVGTVVAISPLASKRMSEEETPLRPGDRVYISATANNISYQFISDRSRLVVDFDGLIAVPHNYIEAIVNTPTNG